VRAAPFLLGPKVTTADGVEIATYDFGGDGSPLLLAHATGFHGRVWLPVADTLRRHFHCWSFDARGHGESGKAPDGNYAWEGFGLDVLAVVQGLGMEPPRAVGHSCGGAALLLAEEAQPGTFLALYCYEPVVPDNLTTPEVTGSDNPLAAGARRRREVFASRAAARDNYAAKPPFSAFDAAALDAYVQWGFQDLPDSTVQLSCRGEDEARIYEAAWQHRAFRDLAGVGCPVALAAGGQHAHFGIDVVTAIAARIAGPATVEVHEERGHFGPMERPAEIAASIASAFDAAPAA
jgi:pimeloyl-ACP methyl ester carboxylesterase